MQERNKKRFSQENCKRFAAMAEVPREECIVFSRLIFSGTQGSLPATPRFDRSSPSSVQISFIEHELTLPQRILRIRKRGSGKPGTIQRISLGECSKGVWWLMCASEYWKKCFIQKFARREISQDRCDETSVSKLKKWNNALKISL